jgi:hypothetical protein
MFERASVHHDQRRVDDRPGIHQRAGQRIAAGFDHAGEGPIDHGDGVVGERERKHAGGQPLGADGDGDLERPMLARQPGQRAGLGKGDAGGVAGLVGGLGEDHRSEGRRRQIDHLAVNKMRRQLPRDVALCEGWRRAQDQLGVADRFGDVGGYQRQLGVVGALRILDHDARAGLAMLGDRRGIAPPQADIMALQCKITRGRKRTVATAQNCYAHHRTFSFIYCVHTCTASS